MVAGERSDRRHVRGDGRPQGAQRFAHREGGETTPAHGLHLPGDQQQLRGSCLHSRLPGHEP